MTTATHGRLTNEVAAALAAFSIATADAAMVGCAFDNDRRVDVARSIAPDTDGAREVQARVIDRHRNADATMRELLSDMSVATARVIDAHAHIPDDVQDGIELCALALSAVHQFSDELLGITIEWRNLDGQSGRTRAAVVARLMETAGLSASAAEKAVSGDPEYTELKDKIAVALNAKEEVQLAYDVALEELKTQRAILHALAEAGPSRPRAGLSTRRERERDAERQAEGGASLAAVDASMPAGSSQQ